VEYGSYACPHCRAANARITEVRSQLGDRLRYVFRHRPLIGSDIARPAAELVESTGTQDDFWRAHVSLMTRSATLTEEDLHAVAATLGLTRLDADTARETAERARQRVDADIDSARASGVRFTPTFFINGRRTDTAFAVALIAMLGARVPVELRIFLTAAAIVDDIGAIIVVAIFYSGDLQFGYLAAALALTGLLALLNRSGIYRVSPYLLVGVALWACVHAGGLHATLAGVILAALIPTRPPPDYKTLAMQADAILTAEAQHSGEQFRLGPSAPALQALDAIHDRLESPADRMLRTVAPRSSYLVLPIFALANAGVAVSTDVFSQHGLLVLAIMAGLAIGKPLGFILVSALAVRLRLAQKPDAYSWRQLAGAGALAGIGFTMSLFIAGQAFPVAGDFAVAKIAVFAASVLASVLGVAVLWSAPARKPV
jgi:Na+/H+ antiporter NhaA